MTAMTDPLVLALDAFIREHEYWGELDSSVGGDCVWMDCTCGGGGHQPSVGVCASAPTITA
jgi:hypothetical protein